MWDGSKQSDTVEHLTSHSLDKLRSQGEDEAGGRKKKIDGGLTGSLEHAFTMLSINFVVCGWDGEENSIDDGSVEEDKKKPPRDSWDKELDKGKVRDITSSIPPHASHTGRFSSRIYFLYCSWHTCMGSRRGKGGGGVSDQQ